MPGPIPPIPSVRPTHPTAFISYSWDDETRKAWVKELATQLRAGGVDVRLDHWHTAPGDQLPEFMEREIRDNDYVIIVCTPKYKAKSEGRMGGVGYEGDIMTAEVFAQRNHRKFIPILATGTWQGSAPSWLRAKRHVDLSDSARYADGHQDLLTTIHGARPKPPALGPLPSSSKPSVQSPPGAPASSASREVNLQLYDRRFPIYEAALRLIDHVIEKGTCTQEELNLFVKNTKGSRHLFNQEIESYLQKLSGEAVALIIGEHVRSQYDSTSDEHRKSRVAWADRMTWFGEQINEVKRLFDPFL